MSNLFIFATGKLCNFVQLNKQRLFSVGTKLLLLLLLFLSFLMVRDSWSNSSHVFLKNRQIYKYCYLHYGGHTQGHCFEIEGTAMIIAFIFQAYFLLFTLYIKTEKFLYCTSLCLPPFSLSLVDCKSDSVSSLSE